MSDVDVLVIGAGACGMIAALRAAQAGARVAVLEKMAQFAGNTGLSCGSIPAAGTRLQRAAGVEDSVEHFLADLERVAGPHENAAMTRRLVTRSAEVVDWLEAHCGVEMKLYTNYRHVGHTVPRLHTQPNGRGSELVEALARACRAAGIDIAFGSPVTRLVTDAAGAVGGVEVGSGAGRQALRAGKTVIACGGYGGNRALLRELIPEIAEAEHFGAPSNAGEAIDWGRALGARLGNVGAYQAHASVARPHGILLTWSVTEKGALYVNRSGRRFGDESLGYSGFGAQVMAQGNEAFAVYDARIRDYVAHYQPTYQALVDAGAAPEFPSADAAAAAFDIDPAALAQTIATYNRAARGEAPDPLGRRDFGRAPLAAPYVLTRVGAALFHTQGGLMVDADARVLREGGGVVANLFAGGGAAAGVSGQRGGRGYVSGNGLLAAAVQGYLAGEAAAAELAPRSTQPCRDAAGT